MPRWDVMDWSGLSSLWCCDEGNANYLKARECYRNLYMATSTRFHPYKHSNFDDDAQRDPAKIHASFFEMAAGLFFKNQEIKTGFVLQKTPDSEGLPDLLLSSKTRNLWIECTLPQRGNKQEYSVPKRNMEVPHPFAKTESLLRLANCVCDKKKQYMKRIEAKRVSIEDLYIIAICGDNLEIPNFPIDSKESILVCDIQALLNGNFLTKTPNVKLGTDFERGILYPSFSDQKKDNNFCIKLFQDIPVPSNLAVFYFNSAHPIAPDACTVFCLNESIFVDFCRSLSINHVSLETIKDTKCA